MFSSAKFLSPIVTAGLPTPGPLLAGFAAVLEVLELVVLEPVDDDLLLPHAASATPSASSASAVHTPRVNVLRITNRPPVIKLPPLSALLGFFIEIIINKYMDYATAPCSATRSVRSAARWLCRRRPRGVSAR